MADSYGKRIEAARLALEQARRERDGFYPGSVEWEGEHAKVQEWERVIEDLRRSQAS